MNDMNGSVEEIVAETGAADNASKEPANEKADADFKTEIKTDNKTEIKSETKPGGKAEVVAESKEEAVTDDGLMWEAEESAPKTKAIKQRKKKKRSYKGILVLAALLALLGTVYYMFKAHTIKTVNVTGNQVVSEEVIRDAVLASAPLNNTMLLKYNTKFHPIEDIPFVAKLDIDIVDKDTVNVTVYEKSLSGCVEYMNGYVFFDKDGIVLEAGNHLIKGVPCIKGLKFDNWEMGERLPVSDVARFQSILSITQLVEKYHIDLSGIKFTPEDEIELSCGSVTVELGRGDYIAIQLMNLGSILEQLGDLKGTLYMNDFKTSGSTASFSRK